MEKNYSPPAAWVVRANPHHISRIDEFKKDKLVALGWPGLGSLAGKDLIGIKARLRSAADYRLTDARELGTNAGLLDTFVNRVGLADRVLVPDPKNDAVHVGEISGNYKYASRHEAAGYPHQRRVQWLFSLPRHQLPPTVIASLRAQQPIFASDSAAMNELVRQFLVRSSLDLPPTDLDTDANALEGQLEYYLSKRAKRDRKLRDRKIVETLKSSGGRLVCETPGCGFDFEATYGELGKGFAHIHHRRKLRSRNGVRKTSLSGLAIVCANCHAMIHRYGGCRALEELMIRP
jgi:hypothetical protein